MLIKQLPLYCKEVFTTLSARRLNCLLACAQGDYQTDQGMLLRSCLRAAVFEYKMMLDFVVPIDNFIVEQRRILPTARLFTMFIHFRGSSHRIDTIPNLIIADTPESKLEAYCKIVGIDSYLKKI